jgi:hypothetical protein
MHDDLKKQNILTWENVTRSDVREYKEQRYDTEYIWENNDFRSHQIEYSWEMQHSVFRMIIYISHILMLYHVHDIYRTETHGNVVLISRTS